MPYEEQYDTYLWRGGEKIGVKKVPDRFTARLKRGIKAKDVATSSRSAHRRSLTRQNLEEFAVDAAERDATMERVRDSGEVEFASHVYTLDSDPTARFFLTDEITVQFKPEVSDDEIERLAAELGLELSKEVRGVPRTYVFRVGPQAKENPIKIANRLLENGSALVSEPNIAVATKSLYVPTDSLFSEQWHLHHSGGPTLTAGSHVDAVRAWDVTRGVRGVIVAVADDSCDTGHTDFQGAGKIVAPRDFAGQDFAPLPEAADDNHGTACAGVAVAEENGQGVVGVAPGCALMPIRTSGTIDDSAIEDLCDWVVDHGAAVLSCSWSAAAVAFQLSLRMRTALTRAASAGRNGLGCVLVFAAGNSNRPVDGVVNESGWPNGYLSGPTRWLNGFAVHPDVIAVAASTSLARKSAYSNWGAAISVCAPSNNAPPDTFPEVSAALPGRGVVTTDRVGASGYSSSDYTRSFGGTSSACPTVAGVAGLVLSANPNLTAREVKEILQSTADKIQDANPDPQLGQSLGTYDANGHSPWFGFGKVNAFRAMSEAVRRRAGGAGEVIGRGSNAALDIPDDDAAGVRSTISFSEDVTAADIRVRLDITHPYIGDLRVTLTPPSGPSVDLHNRGGGNANDIKRAFDRTSTPGLATLLGRSIKGAWSLHVRDLAAADTGRLNRWEIEVVAETNGAVEVEDAPGVTIPDNRPAGIQRALAVAATGTVKSIEVSLDVTHSYIGDLLITLLSPAGTEVILHQRTGGQADNIIRTYDVGTTPALQTLTGEAIQGQWGLQIADLEAVDVGKLNRWGLRIEREA